MHTHTHPPPPYTHKHAHKHTKDKIDWHATCNMQHATCNMQHATCDTKGRATVTRKAVHAEPHVKAAARVRRALILYSDRWKVFVFPFPSPLGGGLACEYLGCIWGVSISVG